MGSEDVKVRAMNMYKYKEGLRFYKRWPCSTYSSKDLTTDLTTVKLVSGVDRSSRMQNYSQTMKCFHVTSRWPCLCP